NGRRKVSFWSAVIHHRFCFSAFLFLFFPWSAAIHRRFCFFCSWFGVRPLQRRFRFVCRTSQRSKQNKKTAINRRTPNLLGCARCRGAFVLFSGLRGAANKTKAAMNRRTPEPKPLLPRTDWLTIQG